MQWCCYFAPFEVLELDFSGYHIFKVVHLHRKRLSESIWLFTFGPCIATTGAVTQGICPI